jgi:hypothetical protein
MAAVFYSIVETCKMSGVDPRRYLMTTMTAILTKNPVPMPWDLVEKPVSKTADSETPAQAAESAPKTASCADSKAVL